MTQEMVASLRALRFAWRRRQVHSLFGAAAVDGSRLHVVTDLQGDALEYWSGLLFDGAPARIPLGLERVSQRLARDRDADLVVMSHHRLFRRRARRAGWLTLPSWLDTGIPIGPTVEDTLAAQACGRRSRQSDLRRIRRAGLRPAIERGAAAVRGFLRDWYEPYVHARWGETCVDLADDDRRHAERDGEILWVMHDRDCAAGVLLEEQGDALRMVVIGMVDAAWRREGALAAAYYFAIEEAVRRGRRWLRTGGTRPTLSDGVLEFKRKWGAHVRRVHQSNYLALGCPAWTPTLRASFARHPLVAEAKEGEFLACTDACALLRPPSAAAREMFELGGLADALVPAERGGWARVPLPRPGGYLGELRPRPADTHAVLPMASSR
jgi:hypothetical protein